ncbi:glycosyltransferase [Candidatus Dojkabacteria bacterium]|jgi:GT2 family glycosyltransferase|nr:glycosyltransferase [Candidatus Dojkabacteria bacterium]
MNPEQTKPIDIVMTTWGREKMTSLSLDAFKRNTKYPYRLILIDNGSAYTDAEYFRDSVDIYVKLDRNRGLEYAKWIGMRFVESELFVSTDNDILPYLYDPDWLSQLVGLMNNNSDYGAIALRPQVLIGTGNIFDGRTEDIVEFGHVPGYARIMRTDLVNECGAWQDKRELRGHEEYWIGEKMRERGFKMGFANNLKCWHLFGDDSTDKWGYYKDMKPEEHGHNEVAGIPGNDRQSILDGVGMDIDNWGTKNWETV